MKYRVLFLVVKYRVLFFSSETQGLVVLVVISVLEESVSSLSRIVEINSVLYVTAFT